MSDLEHYQAVERTPLKGSYRGLTILTAPLPSSGGIGILQMLGMLEDSGYEKSGSGSAAAIHYVAEVMRRSFADRSQYLGDADFVKVPVQGLLDPAYLRQRRESIDPQHATPSDQLSAGKPAGREGTETTHYSIIDAAGNAVAVTYTLNNSYGSGVTVPGLGFLLNDEMDDFTSKPNAPNLFGLVQGEANAIQPGKRPLSAMSPTIVLRDGQPYLILGSPGGPRIVTAVLQVLLNVIDFHMNIQDAVDAPRFHHQWKPDTLYLERGISPDTVALLQARGHHVDYSPGVVLARISAILIDQRLATGRRRLALGGQGCGILELYRCNAASPTLLLVNHRLSNVLLDHIWDAGIPLVEIFCARQHLDYHNRAQIAELGHWFRESELKLHSVHSPMYNDEYNGRSGPQAVINITEPVKGKRMAMLDEIKRGIGYCRNHSFSIPDPARGRYRSGIRRALCRGGFHRARGDQPVRAPARGRGAARKYSQRAVERRTPPDVSRRHPFAAERLFRRGPRALE